MNNKTWMDLMNGCPRCIFTWDNSNIIFYIFLIKILVVLITISSPVMCCEYFSFEGDEGNGWVNHLTPSWHLDTDEHNLGRQSLKSGAIIIGDDRIDTISRRCRDASKSGNVSFSWKTNFSSNQGKLSFYINNIEVCSCSSDRWTKAGPFDFNKGDRIEWRATRDVVKTNLIGNGWIDDICIRYDDDLENCCQSNIFEDSKFDTESFAPNTGSILDPFRFEIGLNNFAALKEPAKIELQIKNESNGLLEIQKILTFDELSDRIIFDDIRFVTPGQKKYRFFYGSYSSKEYPGPVIKPLAVNITPNEGSNLNSYNYSIDRPRDFAENRSEMILEIKDPGSSEWKCFGIGNWNENNITFYIPHFNFLNPYLGEIEFRFSTDYGIIGPFRGPYIFINFKNIELDPNMDLVTADVRSDRCGERICLSTKQKTYEQNYLACPNWESIKWINIMLDNDGAKIRSCT